MTDDSADTSTLAGSALDPATAAMQGPAATAGLVLARFIVPLWVLVGASAKLIERSPRLLPEHLRKGLEAFGADLHLALAAFIAVEFAAVAVMVLVPRLARITAVFMLGSFCLVLLWEMTNGNVTDCGCLATFSPPPWAMLMIDGLLLLGVCALPIRRIAEPNARAGWALVSLISVAMGTLAFIRVPASGVTVLAPLPIGTVDGTDGSALHTPVAPTVQLPAYHQPDLSSWAGQRVEDIPLLQWTQLPENIDKGQHYVIYFSRTCEHCHELLVTHFDFDLPAPTTLVAIPESLDGFETEGLLPDACPDCGEVKELPVGVDWLMTPPLVIAIEDGIVTCAQEAEDPYEPQCLPFHGF